MKLLFIYQYGILGGVVAQLRNRFAALRDRAEFHFIFLEDHGGTAAFGNYPNVQILPQPEQLQEFLTREEFDIISVIDTPQAYTALKQSGAKALVVNEVHTTYRVLDYLNDLRPDPPMQALITPSEYLRQRVLGEYGYQQLRPVYVVPNCLDISAFNFQQQRAVPDKKVLLWVGKLDEHKNWRDFLALSAKVKKERVDCEFWMVGGETASDDTAREMLRAADEADLLPHLRWLQRLEYQKMPKLYSMVAQSGGAAVITSTDESFGMSAVEALACKCPVLASNVGALPEIFTGELSGFLYSLHDLDAALVKLRVLLDNDKQQQRIGEFGRQIVRQRFSVDTVGNSYLQLLESLAAKSH